MEHKSGERMRAIPGLFPRRVKEGRVIVCCGLRDCKGLVAQPLVTMVSLF
jgi:hypothetical protein